MTKMTTYAELDAQLPALQAELKEEIQSSTVSGKGKRSATASLRSEYCQQRQIFDCISFSNHNNHIFNLLGIFSVSRFFDASVARII